MYTEIRTVEAALARHADKIDLQKVNDSLVDIPGKFRRGMMALITLQMIIHTVNNDDPREIEWKADYNNVNQKKWFPWYEGGAADASGSGFRFGVTYCGWTDTHTVGGARLALKDEARAEHMNTYFSDLYKDLYLILE